MTTDHPRPVLDNVRDSHLFFTVVEQLSRAHTPQVIVNTTISPVVEFQCAMTTRAGMECVAHALQALTEADSTQLSCPWTACQRSI